MINTHDQYVIYTVGDVEDRGSKGSMTTLYTCATIYN